MSDEEREALESMKKAVEEEKIVASIDLKC